MRNFQAYLQIEQNCKYLMRYLLVFLIMLTSCGPKYPKNPYLSDQEFDIYVKNFEQFFLIKNNVPIVFESLGDSKLGLCRRYTPNNKSNWVKINPEYWQSMDEVSREQLIFHELGHCVFGLDHVDEFIVINGITMEKSIMNTYHFGYKSTYRMYRPYYIQELLERARK